MAVGNRRKERADWVRKSLEEYRAQLKERENRTAALYDALTDFTRALDAARPIVQDYTRDYGVSRREIGERFGLTQRQLNALFEPLIDADSKANDVKPQTSETTVTPSGPESQSKSVAVIATESVVSANHATGDKQPPSLGILGHPIDYSDAGDSRRDYEPSENGPFIY
ncbi:hypothetical protein JS533_005555 [Bifidobacterium amazonense]|uniref:Gas vesicle protein n=3 Tax=Bifidobacterium TaxID=1678 RepID=A0ABS9VUU3_9BIFI|nr:MULTISPECIES: hypothetical protein [Bifidobacterium]MBT1173304.1 hypothetical protein [Bifidobacterium santillanense]MBT1174106.1 hypothetical protein [Bifidobacterium colobi]MCH9275736.1 hypothetical protein [Bifidobacterium amazonense]